MVNLLQRTAVDERHVEAEMSVIGSMLIDNEVIGIVMSEVTENEFSNTYKTVFMAIRELFNENVPVDPVIVNHKLGDCYGQFLLELMQVTPTAANIKPYLRILKEQSLLRKANDIGAELADARDAEEVRELIDKAGRLFSERPGRKIINSAELLTLFYDNQFTKAEYLTWGLAKLDENIYAEPGDFIVIGGRPSVGKTALAIEFALHQAKTKKVGFFSLETGPLKFADRMVSHDFRLNLRNIKRHNLSKAELDRVLTNSEAFCKRNIEFIHASGMTAAEIQSIALARKYDIIYVDYLQIVNSGLPKALATEQVRNISLGLHTLSQSNGITVVSLAQLKRPQTKEDAERAPVMGDLKESGQIEQDADIIMFLYLKNPGQKNGPRCLKVAKNKEGELGSFTLEFEGQFQTFGMNDTVFEETDDEDDPPEQFHMEAVEEGEKDESRPKRFVSRDEMFRGKKK